MPGKKKGKKGKAKGKKSSSKKVTTTVPTSAIEDHEEVFEPPPAPREKLIKLLTSNPVHDRELFGMRISSHALKNLTPQEIRDLRVVFEAFDFKESGYLGVSDIQKALKTLGFAISRKDTKQLVKDNGVSKPNRINFNEFLDAIIEKQGDARDVYDEISQGFQYFDYDKSGKISLDNLKQACEDSGVTFNAEELNDMLLEADLNGDGFVDKEEFIKIILQTNLY